MDLLTFHLGDREFGVDLGRVLEIVNPPPITRVPGMPPALLGLIGLRGEPTAVVDAGLRLAGERVDVTVRTPVVILRASVDGRWVPFGLLVEAAGRRVAVERLLPWTEGHAELIGKDACIGFADLDGRLVLVLDVDRLLVFPPVQSSPPERLRPAPVRAPAGDAAGGAAGAVAAAQGRTDAAPAGRGSMAAPAPQATGNAAAAGDAQAARTVPAPVAASPARGHAEETHRGRAERSARPPSAARAAFDRATTPPADRAQLRSSQWPVAAGAEPLLPHPAALRPSPATQPTQASASAAVAAPPATALPAFAASLHAAPTTASTVAGATSEPRSDRAVIPADSPARSPAPQAVAPHAVMREAAPAARPLVAPLPTVSNRASAAQSTAALQQEWFHPSSAAARPTEPEPWRAPARAPHGRSGRFPAAGWLAVAVLLTLALLFAFLRDGGDPGPARRVADVATRSDLPALPSREEPVPPRRPAEPSSTLPSVPAPAPAEPPSAPSAPARADLTAAKSAAPRQTDPPPVAAATLGAASRSAAVPPPEDPSPQPAPAPRSARPIPQAMIVTADTPACEIHEVRKGDTLWWISARRLGDPYRWPELFGENRERIADPNVIEIHDRIRIPGACAHPSSR